tara:strand:- start:358 stop:627 length:270 start_codon:yes stop_codon:yes gene_type:complete
MTDFNNWYAKTLPDLDPYLDDISDELRMAYEAGVGQAKTLRDEFAMAALSNHRTQLNGPAATPDDIATVAYGLADAMLEARKATGGGEA